METINDKLINWLQQVGLGEDGSLLVHRVVVVLAILFIAYVLNKLCRQVIIPTIRKVTSKTQVTWDDYLLNDRVLGYVCHLVPPVIIYVLIPFALPHEPELLAFVLKLCWIYMTIVVMKLICAFLSSLYAISSEHERLKNHSLKGFYQMLKLIVVCIGSIIIIST